MPKVNIEKMKKALTRKGIEYTFENVKRPVFFIGQGTQVQINRFDTEITIYMHGLVEAEYKNDYEITGIEIGKAVRKVAALKKKYFLL